MARATATNRAVASRGIKSAADISGLVLDLNPDISASVTLDGSNNISAIADQSASALTASQATPAKRPAYVTNVINGRAVMRAVSAQLSSLSTGAISYGAFTRFVVMRGTVAGMVVEHGSGVGDFLYSVNTATTYVQRSGVTSYYNNTLASGDPAWGTDNAWRVVVDAFDGSHAGHRFRTNGQVRRNASAELAGEPGTGALSDVVWLMARAGTSLAITGDIARVLIYNRALAPGEIQQVEQYLGRLYDIGVGQVDRGKQNLLLQSNTFNVTWVTTRIAAPALDGSVTDPAGGTSTWRIAADANNNNHFISQAPASYVPGPYTAYAILRAGEETAAVLQMVSASGPNYSATFNLANGTVSAEDIAGSASVRSLGGGWYLCAMAQSVVSGAWTTGLRIYPRSASSYVGNSSNGIRAYAAGVMQGRQLAATIQHVVTTTAADVGPVRQLAFNRQTA